jgi:hypothetical protein
VKARPVTAGLLAAAWLSLSPLMVSVTRSAAPEVGPCRHPVNVAPVRTTIPADAPLPEGRLACETCHPALPAGTLRWTGDPRLTCFQCHAREAFQRFYPHGADPQDPVGSRLCLYCHLQQPMPGTEGVKLRAGVRVLCQGCHRPVPHVGAAEHAGVLGEAMDRRRRVSQDRAGVLLPLDEQGQMGCGTCHNPHDPAAIPGTEPAGRIAPPEDPVVDPQLFGQVLVPTVDERTARAGTQVSIRKRNRSGSRLRLPLGNGALCLACHDVFGAAPPQESSAMNSERLP